MKQCTKCKEWKELDEFHKNKNAKDGHRNECKECVKEYQKKYRKNSPDKIKETGKQYRRKNKEKILENGKKYYENTKCKRKEYAENNKGKIKEYKKINNNFNAKYESNKDKLTIDESPRLNEDGISLEVKCRYCGKYHIPTNLQIKNRIQALNSKSGRENGLYCSDGCKESCPIYNQRLWPKGFKTATSREVQPELRQMVLLRDNYECQKCGSTESLHCHHIWPLNESPITSADVGECVTLCKSCHKEIHMNVPGCSYGEMRGYDCDILT